MNVAVMYDKFGKNSASGARISIHTLLKGVPDSDRITVFDSCHGSLSVPDFIDSRYAFATREVPKLVWTNQVLHRWQWRRKVRPVFMDAEHDILISQGEVGPAAVRMAAEAGTPSMLFIRSLQVTGTEKFDARAGSLSNFSYTDFGGKIQFPFLLRNVSEYRNAIQTADIVVANSEFTAAEIRKRFGVESEVIYPPIRLSDYRVTPDPEGHITMVNPRSRDKGVDIFLDIAETLSQETFQLVGPVSPESERKRAEELDNVTLLGWTDDMQAAYGRSKLVVVPSRYDEPFGRVAAEAMVSGIPCVVSDRGGLPEVVGDTGEVVGDIESEQAWLDAVEDALATDRSDEQRERAERFAASAQITKLNGLIEDLV